MDEIERLIEIEKNLRKYEGDDEVVFSTELKEMLEKEREQGNEVSMKSGLPTLDLYLDSFDGGELTIISGPTKNGKTLLAQTFTNNMYAQGKKALWFSYEVPMMQFLKQFGEPLPLFLHPKHLKSKTLPWIESRIHEAKVKFGIDAVFIDNSHHIVDLKSQHRTHLMDALIIKLDEIAEEHNIHVFLMHHITKTKLDGGDSIGSYLLRDSSMIAQTADNVLFIWRNKEDSDEATLKITENRRNGVMNKYVNLIKEGKYLEEVADVKAKRHGWPFGRTGEKERKDIHG